MRIFRAAMEQQRSLADYAQTLDIGADSLRAIVTAQLDDVELSALDRLADLYQQSRQTLREQFSITPPQESFAAWLKRNMEGISQQALRTRVQLDSKTLKRFLNGEMLPDSDQAERLARALYIDRTELARVVTATATAMPTTAPIPPANTPRPAPSTASTTTALGSTAALTPSVVAADTTTLQLTADEVRLIRHWRQLHPHGRRATLHYIGSLLVED